jgi:hypothetical protein
MTLTLALAALENISVTGINVNFGTNIPRHVDEVDLPALQINVDSIFEPSLEAANVTLTKGAASFRIQHMLIVSSINVFDANPAAVTAERNTLVDNYLAAISGDQLLNDTLAEPLRIIATYMTPFDEFGLALYGCRFVHQWEIVYG